jgi:opacity protein-like surface antigen
MKSLLLCASLAVAGLTSAWAPAAQAAGSVDCKLRFNLSGWSVFYKTSSGSGTVHCSNGQSMSVKINAKGGGLTVGKSRIENGVGEFSGVHNISEVLGTYATAEAHAGAVKSSKAQVMTKGEVSLALAGKGEGWDLGVAFGKFVISR